VFLIGIKQEVYYQTLVKQGIGSVHALRSTRLELLVDGCQVKRGHAKQILAALDREHK